MFEAQRWHSMFPAFMTKISNNSHIFVQDFVVYRDSLLSKTIAKVLWFYEKVILTFEQFWRLHPKISMLNCNQTYIIADHSEIHVDYVELSSWFVKVEWKYYWTFGVWGKLLYVIHLYYLCQVWMHIKSHHWIVYRNT